MTAHSFRTSTGVIVPAITTEQMREVDRVAIEEVGPNLFQMMENAGRNLALSAIDLLGSDWQRSVIVVLAGTGGNGGGGIAAARHLANRGAHVTVAVTDRARLGPVPTTQLDVFGGTDGRLVHLAELAGATPGLVIDALIGYSLAGAPRGTARDMIEWCGATGAPVLSLDVPSGLDSTSGAAPGVVVEATRTLTLALPKQGLAAPQVGDLWLADIGIPVEVYRRVGVDVAPTLFGSEYRVRLEAAGAA